MRITPKILTVISFIVLVYSCFSLTVKANFIIINDTEFIIDSLRIEPNSIKQNKYISLEPGKAIDYVLDMTHIPKTDGSYVLKYIINDTLRTKNFGYYTNGAPLEKNTLIEIKKDTIKIDMEFLGQY